MVTGDDSTRAVIAALSACTGMDIGTTCDSLNQLLQSFDMLADGLQDVLQTLRQAFTEVSQDICEPCRYRGTMHGSSMKKAMQKQAKANSRWQENADRHNRRIAYYEKFGSGSNIKVLQMD